MKLIGTKTFRLGKVVLPYDKGPDDQASTQIRKVLVFNLVSLDGCFEGPNRDISWHNVTSGGGMDKEFNGYAVEMLNSVDTLIFGRMTYELMASYWPTPDVMKNDPIVAERMNNLHKIVFSRTLDKAEWHNTRMVQDNKAPQQEGYSSCHTPPRTASGDNGRNGQTDKRFYIF